MVMLSGQKDRMRAREYHWRAGLYVNSSLDVHDTLKTERFEL